MKSKYKLRLIWCAGGEITETIYFTECIELPVDTKAFKTTEYLKRGVRPVLMGGEWEDEME